MKYVTPHEHGPVRYPFIAVQLTDTDGNAFSIIGRVRKALVHGGVSPDEVASFTRDATSGDYHHVLATCERWVQAH